MMNYIRFNGRINRLTFWKIIVICLAIITIAEFLKEYETIKIPVLLTIILTKWIVFVTHIKRLHDIDYSGWWVLFPVISRILAIIISNNHYGWFFLFFIIIPYTFTIMIGSLSGTAGKNKYVENPAKGASSKQWLDDYNKGI